MKSRKNIELLLSALSTTENVKIIKKNQIFTSGTFDEPRCTLFHRGIISLQRQHDNLLLTNLTAPMIIGLRFISDDMDIKNFPLYFRAESDVSYEFIHPQDAKKKINDKQLWESVAMYQMMITARLTNYLDNMSNVNSSNLIEYCLEKLCHEPEQIRYRRTAVDYIMDKTNLSRSNISKILATLKKEGKITTHKGLLLSKMKEG